MDVGKLDITKTNLAVQELIEVTENPRHRYLLQAYDRHRNLEHAGRVDEIFAREMMVERPVYRFNMKGQPPMVLEGREQIEPLYRYWAETNQSVFYNEQESVAVGDFLVVSTMVGYQQVLGSDLAAAGQALAVSEDGEIDPDAMYLLRGRVAMVWPYDERGRLVGENVWEYDESEHELTKLDPDQVLTTERSRELLDPHIRPLPPFEESMVPASSPA